MNNNTHPLKKVSQRILEDWAMMLVDDAETAEGLFDKSSPVFMSWIKIHGVVEGALTIVAQEDFIKTLAHNLLGRSEEEPLTDAECKDAFKEMGNVLAGNFLTEAYGEDIVFDLIHPNVREITEDELEKFSSRKILFGFMADDQPVAMSFSIKGN